MPIVTGSHPKALVPGMRANVETNAPGEALLSVREKFVPKPKDPPKIKKKAFGDKQPGAAFRK
jgi:hypothetical protein